MRIGSLFSGIGGLELVPPVAEVIGRLIQVCENGADRTLPILTVQ